MATSSSMTAPRRAGASRTSSSAAAWRCASATASSSGKRSCTLATSMSTLLIEGGHRISGAVEVEGNKNAALPLLAACLLTTEECVLTNVPRIAHLQVMARLILDLGGEVEGIGST